MVIEKERDRRWLKNWCKRSNPHLIETVKTETFSIERPLTWEVLHKIEKVRCPLESHKSSTGRVDLFRSGGSGFDCELRRRSVLQRFFSHPFPTSPLPRIFKRIWVILKTLDSVVTNPVSKSQVLRKLVPRGRATLQLNSYWFVCFSVIFTPTVFRDL